MTPEQLALLKTDILVTNAASLAAMATAQDYPGIAIWYNVVASPAFVAWRTSVPLSDIVYDPAFDWTRVDNLSVGKARIWEWMFQQGPINPSQPNIRAGIDTVWVGTAADLAVRTSVYLHCKRNVLRGEKVFATGTGTTATPATMGFEGGISPADVSAALQLP